MSWLTDMLKNLFVGSPPAARPSRSANGASSFHLAWEMPGGLGREVGFVEVSAVLEIVVPPRVSALYFWALQVDFLSGGKVIGGAHTGLQWNPRYPGSRAVNWGGYASSERGGSVLPGTRSRLPGFRDDPNTLGYDWLHGRPYRLRVFRSPAISGAWRSEVTDLVSGVTRTVRDLLPEEPPRSTGSYLLRPVVWSEVFAACDAPSVTVRWSDLRAVDAGGVEIRPSAVRVNYQAWQDGGCPNTTAGIDDEGGYLQVTNTARVVEQDVFLRPPAKA
jgi:hypothetical protein